MSGRIAEHDRTVVGISIPVERNRTENIAKISILRNKVTGRSTVIPRPEILQASVEIIVIAVVGVAVEVVDVNDHRRVDGLHVAERIVGVPQEHRAVLRRGLRHVAGAVVEIIFLCLVDILHRVSIKNVIILVLKQDI